MTTTAIASAAVENGLAGLAFSRGAFNKLLDSIPDDKVLEQPFADANHVMWQAGHIAVSEDFFLREVGGCDRICPEEWNALFNMGSNPTTNTADYPSFAEVRVKLNETRDALNEWFSSKSDDDLNQPLSEELKGFAPTVGALMGSLACHEGMHIGEILALRKAMSLGYAFGLNPE